MYPSMHWAGKCVYPSMHWVWGFVTRGGVCPGGVYLPRECSGRYASYWNAFLLSFHFNKWYIFFRTDLCGSNCQ